MRIFAAFRPPPPRRPDMAFHAKTKCRKRRYDFMLPLDVMLPAAASDAALAVADASAAAANAAVRHDLRREIKRLVRLFVGRRKNRSLATGPAALSSVTS